MYTPMQLDKSRNLRYGMKALSLIEKKLKRPIAKIDMENMSIEDMAVFVWAGLVHEDSSLTPDKVMDLVDEHSNMVTAFEAMNEAFNEAFGSGEEPEEKNAQEVASSAS